MRKGIVRKIRIFKKKTKQIRQRVLIWESNKKSIRPHIITVGGSGSYKRKDDAAFLDAFYKYAKQAGREEDIIMIDLTLPEKSQSIKIDN